MRYFDRVIAVLGIGWMVEVAVLEGLRGHYSWWMWGFTASFVFNLMLFLWRGSRP